VIKNRIVKPSNFIPFLLSLISSCVYLPVLGRLPLDVSIPKYLFEEEKIIASGIPLPSCCSFLMA
jgi:hypothetical protein